MPWELFMGNASHRLISYMYDVRNPANRTFHIYLAALNRAVQPNRRFSGGTGFHGEILVKFAQGSYIWRLEWRTTAPGVTQYQWTRSREPFDTALAAHEAAQWVEISEQELKQYGGWVAQAVEGMVDRRERLATIREAVGAAIHMMGGFAVLLISSTQPANSPSGSAGGKVLPFPKRPLPVETPARLPAASGM
jgi:hypothetical protein